MLDIRKVSLMLQSGHKSRRLDLIFDFLWSVSNLFIMLTPVCSFVVIHFLKWLMQTTMIDNFCDKQLINKTLVTIL